MMYFPGKDRLCDADCTPIKNDEILNEIREIHASRGADELRKEKEKRKSSTSVVRRRAFSVDEYIEANFKVVHRPGVLEFYVKGREILAGQIGYYNKGRFFSFDLNKFEKSEGEFKGIGYLMVYYLMKHVASTTGHTEVQIEAFDSGRGTESLKQLYMGMGMDSGLHGDVQVILMACQGAATRKFGNS